MCLGPRAQRGYCYCTYSCIIKCESCYAALLLLRCRANCIETCALYQIDFIYLTALSLVRVLHSHTHTTTRQQLIAKYMHKTIYYTCCWCWYSLKQTATMCVNSVHYRIILHTSDRKLTTVYLESMEVLHLSQITFSKLRIDGHTNGFN